MAHIKLALITGSGLDFSSILDSYHQEQALKDIFHLLDTRVMGHKHQIIHGYIGPIPTIICNGRIHAYEGYPFGHFKDFLSYFKNEEVTHLISINAVGGLNNLFPVGSFVAIEKVISIPYHPFPLPSIIYPSWIFQHYPQRGVYIWVSGPSYETKSELRLFHAQGGDVIGMSGAPELYWALRLGIKTAMFSCITNYCFSPIPLSHEQVVATAQKACKIFVNNLKEMILKELI